MPIIAMVHWENKDIYTEVSEGKNNIAPVGRTFL